jgi:hypothetical protein
MRRWTLRRSSFRLRVLICKYGVLGFRQDLLNGLTGLTADVFANIANTLTLVGLRVDNNCELQRQIVRRVAYQFLPP